MDSRLLFQDEFEILHNVYISVKVSCTKIRHLEHSFSHASGAKNTLFKSFAHGDFRTCGPSASYSSSACTARNRLVITLPRK